MQLQWDQGSQKFALLLWVSSLCWFHVPYSGKDVYYQSQEVLLWIDSLTTGKSLSLPGSDRQVSGKTDWLCVSHCPTAVHLWWTSHIMCLLDPTPTPCLHCDGWSHSVGGHWVGSPKEGVWITNTRVLRAVWPESNNSSICYIPSWSIHVW